MKDDVRLAVKLYMPHGAKAGEKFPAVLEYHPYRKDDGPTPIPNTAPSSVKPKASSG